MKQNIFQIIKPLRVYQIGLLIFLFTLPLENRYSNIGLIALGIGWIFTINRSLIVSTIRSKTWILLVLSLLWFLLGLIFSYNEFLIDYSEKIGKYTLLIVLPLLIAPSQELSKPQLRISLMGFVISVFCILAISYLNVWGLIQAGEKNPFNYALFVANGGDFHPAYISMFVVFSIFLCLEALRFYRSMWMRIALILCLLVFFPSVFIIQARTALIAMTILLPVYAFLTIGFKRILVTRIGIISGLFILAIIIILNLGYSPLLLIKDRLFDSFSNSLSIRIETWKCALEVFYSNSWFTGVGSGNEQLAMNECYYSHFLTRQFYESFNTHNDLLLILIRNGLIGILLWIGFLVHIIKRNVHFKFNLGVIFVLLFCICGITEALLSRIWGVLFIGTGIGFCIIFHRIQEESTSLKQKEIN